MKGSTTVSPMAVLRGHEDAIVSLKFLNLMRSMLVSGDASGRLIVWDINVCKRMIHVKAHEKSILSINVVSSLSIATSSRDGTIKLWDLDSICGGAEPKMTLRTGYDHFCNAVPLDTEYNDVSQLVAPGIEQSEIFLWDLRCSDSTASPSMKLSASDGLSDRSQTVGMVTALDAAIAKGKSSSDPAADVSDAGALSGIVSTSHSVVAGGYEDGSVYLFDLRATRPLCRKKVHDEPIFALRMAPTGSTLVTGGGDSCLCRSDWSFDHTHEVQPSIQLHKEQRIQLQEPGTSCVRYRSDGRLLVSSHWDSTVRIFQSKNMKPLAILSHHRDSVYSVDFQHKDPALDSGNAASPVEFATGSKDRTIALWNTFADTYQGL